MINSQLSAIAGGYLGNSTMTVLDDVCDRCREDAPLFSQVKNLLLFPDISDMNGKVEFCWLMGLISNRF